MSESECAICFADITADTGRSVLGCGHTFHMLCVVRWFCEQEGISSCPCCRREAGELDNVPILPGEVEEDEESEDDEDEEESDDEEAEDIEIVWVRAEDGTWLRYWREAQEPLSWKPGTGPAPEPLTEPIQAIQALWRGHTVRSEIAVAGALLSLKDAK